MDHKLLLTTAVFALLVGCKNTDHSCDPFAGCVIAGGNPGGGIGGGTGGPIEIDRDNALAALQEAWFAASTTPVILTFVEATGVGTTETGSFDVDPAGPTVYNCPVSGTFTVTGSIADPNTKTAGDTVNFESSACDSGTGYSVDGNHTINVISVAGDLDSSIWELGQSLSFTGFRATSSTLVTTLDGDYSAVVDTQGEAQAISFSGSSLAIGEEGVTLVVSGYSGFAALEAVDPFNYVVEVAGRASSSAAGTFDYLTFEPLTYPLGELLPDDGWLDVVGLNGSRARLALEPDVGVIVQVDANGNNNFEVSVITTWDEFLAGTISL